MGVETARVWPLRTANDHNSSGSPACPTTDLIRPTKSASSNLPRRHLRAAIFMFGLYSNRKFALKCIFCDVLFNCCLITWAIKLLCGVSPREVTLLSNMSTLFQLGFVILSFFYHLIFINHLQNKQPSVFSGWPLVGNEGPSTFTLVYWGWNFPHSLRVGPASLVNSTKPLSLSCHRCNCFTKPALGWMKGLAWCAAGVDGVARLHPFFFDSSYLLNGFWSCKKWMGRRFGQNYFVTQK